MAIKTQQSLTGFIATEPQRSVNDDGVVRFYARIGQPHFRREPDGTFTELEPTFHDLVAFRSAAEHAFGKFAKGDRFVAEGYVHNYQTEQSGAIYEREEFIAKRIGHDLTVTNYDVDRTRRAAHTTARDMPAPEFTPQSTARTAGSSALGR
ncbi:single-stranded DNA-binding protein [Agromyces seonyuensis]|uniref:Single-stranded DNA-binding protein n=1 Tax=Agromyces seonyuensis TaxID=2662446 RepID=A0A6I4NXQ3_9MICO|nr:single-stranded DNA-binding protein [Agromyces seonyuensis]MWB99028.1 single-stranded DNA-binding protein [Agromyces seonyuensis]